MSVAGPCAVEVNVASVIHPVFSGTLRALLAGQSISLLLFLLRLGRYPLQLAQRNGLGERKGLVQIFAVTVQPVGADGQRVGCDGLLVAQPGSSFLGRSRETILFSRYSLFGSGRPLPPNVPSGRRY